MKMSKWVILILFIATTFPQNIIAVSKPSPDTAIQMLKAGNKRFVEGSSIHPNTGLDRLHQAGTENQGDHAYATVITCSDSRVPVERLFDAGVMDIFVVRVAGNVVDTDEAGSIEYGLAHVNTPVLVVLGHTQCGAVTAVTHAIHGTGHALEFNIPPLVDNIAPAVKRAMSQHASVHGNDIIPYAIVENVWQGVEDLFMKSASTRNLVKSGQAKVVGAIYDVATGMVNWLPGYPVGQILARVEANPQRQMNAMADGGHDAAPAHDNHAAGNMEDQAFVQQILTELKQNDAELDRFEIKMSQEGHGRSFLYLFGLIVLIISVALTLWFAKGEDRHGNLRFQKSLGSKLSLGFSAIILIVAGLSIYASISMQNIGLEIEEISEDIIPITNAVSQIDVYALEQVISLERAFRFGEEDGEHAKEKFDKSIEEFEHLAQKTDERLEELIQKIKETPAITTEAARQMTETLNNILKINSEHHRFESLAKKAIDLIRQGKLGPARILEEEVEKIDQELNHHLESLLASLEKQGEEASQKAKTDEQTAFRIIMILAVISVFMGFLIAIYFVISITRPINRITIGMGEGADQVASASAQVSASSQSMAEGASEQAASIEETSSSMEEMSSMTKKNSESANQADDLMKDTNQVVATANESMGHLIAAMEDISNASEETSKIIKTIDEIAFQTNLLALNAAVEAARAGDAGAGFAVVADEVRNLALRAAEAAKDTAELIEGTVMKVNEGSELVVTTNEAFGRVAQSSVKIGDIIAQISEASKEQTGGISQINTAISEMDKVVQQNAANAEESAAAAEEMNAQAEQLREYTKELVQLVTGKREQGVRTAKPVSHRSKPAHPGTKKMLGQRTKEVRPDQIIPFDEDDFKDF